MTFYICIYALLSMAQTLVNLCKQFALAKYGLVASSALHDAMWMALVRMHKIDARMRERTKRRNGERTLNAKGKELLQSLPFLCLFSGFSLLSLCTACSDCASSCPTRTNNHNLLLPSSLSHPFLVLCLDTGSLSVTRAHVILQHHSDGAHHQPPLQGE